MRRFAKALPSLFLVVLVIGGIVAGIVTATEASALAVLYSFVLAAVVYRELPLREVPAVLVRSALTTAVVMLLIGCSMAFSWVLACERVPEGIGAAFAAIGGGSVVTLLVINLLLLAAGTVLDITPPFSFSPSMFLPVVTPLGIDPVHFGIVMILNLCIGLCTPPVGNVLFVGCGVSESSIPVVSRALVPLYLAMIAALLLVTFVPQITLALPHWLGMS